MSRHYFICRQCKSKFAFPQTIDLSSVKCKNCQGPLADVTQAVQKTVQQKMSSQLMPPPSSISPTLKESVSHRVSFSGDSPLLALGCDPSFATKRSFLRHLVEDLKIPCKVNLDEPSSLPLQTFLNKYLRLEKIGQGATSYVYKAWDDDFQRYVAMKVFAKFESLPPEALERFLEEAQITSQLQHPNIIPVHDIGINEEGEVFFTMKWVQGETLSSFLEKQGILGKVTKNHPKEKAEQFKKKLHECLQIFLKICDGMAYAHSRGVIHRDLKPENIMVGEFGETLIMDWGIARILGQEDKRGKALQNALSQIKEDESSGRRTISGSVFGTPSYMSPEQARGEIDKIDPRSDIFSLGAILYEMLTQTPPYMDKSTLGILLQATQAEITPPEMKVKWDVPMDLSAICMKALTAHPKGRYQRVRELSEDIQCYLESRSISAKEDSVFEKGLKWTKRHKSMTAMLGMTFLFVLMVLGNQVWNWKIQQKFLQEQCTQLQKNYQQSLIPHVERLKFLEDYANIYHQNLQKVASPLEEAYRLKLIEAHAAYTVLYIQIQERITSLLKDFPTDSSLRTLCVQIKNLLKVDSLTYQTHFLLFQESQVAGSLYIQKKLEPYLALEQIQMELTPLYEAVPESQKKIKTLLDKLQGVGTIKLQIAGRTEKMLLYSYQASPQGILEKKPCPFTEELTQQLKAPESYLLEIYLPPPFSEQEPILYPFFLLRGETQELKIMTRYAQKVPEGMRYLPGGKFFQGGEAESSLRYHRTQVSPFLMDIREVTYQDLLPYVTDRIKQGAPLNQVSPAFPRNNTIPAIVQKGSQCFIHPDQDPTIPVIYMTLSQALDYCTWKNEDLKKKGFLSEGYYDVPFEEEWEYAARGADGRGFVWGDVFNTHFANIARLNQQSVRVRAGASFPQDCSLFKIFDLCGNVREWTKTPFKKGEASVIIKGGDFESYEETTRLAHRYVDNPHHSYYRTGFRGVIRFLPERK